MWYNNNVVKGRIESNTNRNRYPKGVPQNYLTKYNRKSVANLGRVGDRKGLVK